MEITVTKFKAKCLGIVEMVERERGSVIITRHGRPAAELVPVSVNAAGQLFGRSKDTTLILGDLLSTGEVWDAEN